jgi:opacity protein-like surface antigen
VKHWPAVIGLAVAVATAHAADSGQSPPSQDQWPGYEVTPFVGLDLGGSFNLDNGSTVGGAPAQHVNLGDRASFALALDLRADDSAQCELFYSRQSTSLHGDSSFAPAPIVVEYLHLGGLLLLDDDTLVKPYIAGGLGLTRLSPEGPASSDTRFSASAGLGLRWPISRHFSLRLEGRGLLTLVNEDAAIFCRSDQSGLLCRIHGRGQTFFQGELLAGAAITF